jgi:hypothetical protein
MVDPRTTAYNIPVIPHLIIYAARSMGIALTHNFPLIPRKGRIAFDSNLMAVMEKVLSTL